MQTVFSYWRETVPEWKEANDQIAAWWKHYPEGSTQLVMAAREDPRETHVLTRGDFLKPAKPVDPGVPAFLNTLPKAVSDPAMARLVFAEWLVDRSAPTTARSLVNRFWQRAGRFGGCGRSEQQVLAADVVVPEPTGILLGLDDDVASGVSEALETWPPGQAP